MNKLSDICEDRRISRPQNNAARERSRVKTLRTAFLDLQKSLPAVPPNTKLSKLDILVLATAYIYHLTRTLENHDPSQTSMQQDIQALEYSQRLAVSEGWGEHGHERVPQESSWLARMSSMDVSNPLMSPALSLSAVTSQIFTTNGHQLQKQVKGAERFSLSSFRPTCHDKTLQTSSSSSDYDLSMRPNRCLHKEYGPHDDNVYHWQQFKNDKQCKQRVMSKSHPSRRGTVGILHPVKKWPMRSRLYDSILGCKTQSQLLSSNTHDASQPNSQ